MKIWKIGKIINFISGYTEFNLSKSYRIFLGESGAYGRIFILLWEGFRCSSKAFGLIVGVFELEVVLDVLMADFPVCGCNLVVENTVWLMWKTTEVFGDTYLLVYYNKASCGRFILRVVLQPKTMDSIGPVLYNEIFLPDNFVFCQSCARS